MSRNSARNVLCFSVAVMLLALTAAQTSRPARRAAKTSTDAQTRWLDRLDAADRTLLEQNIGFALPEFTEGLEWLGANGKPVTATDLDGRVVLVQTWTSRTSAGRKIPVQLERLHEDHADDLAVVLIHTPEDLDDVAAFLKKRETTLPVALDRDGAFCDDVGFFERATNVLVDRNGRVRYAGLNTRGVRAAVSALAAEERDTSVVVESRPVAKAAESHPFPPHEGSVGNAKDLRGKRGPEFQPDVWITNVPNAEGKVVVIDFWATWCGPCLRAIPHMNELAQEFEDEVVIVGVSSENERDYDKGKSRLRSAPPMQYAVALDPDRSISGPFANRSIPYCVVLDSNWIVRWQGHPSRLDAATVKQIVMADQSAASTVSERPRRWEMKLAR